MLSAENHGTQPSEKISLRDWRSRLFQLWCIYLYDERVKFMQALEKSLHFLT
ncbi:MAG: hypothetical protein KME22_30090 [Hassallia sp. WJT32-NPBG1]|nr:hypothetical protein [Hassallia sp. WJT32-NPBG1]